MSLNVCAHCTTKFSIGALHCPYCGNADYYEEGSMPKISRHGGASHPVGVVPFGPELVAGGAVPAGSDVVVVGPVVQLAADVAGATLPPASDEEREAPGLLVDGEGVEGVPGGTEHELVVSPYDGMLRADLQELCRTRGLASSGNKDELIARLVAADEAKAEQDSDPA